MLRRLFWVQCFVMVLSLESFAQEESVPSTYCNPIALPNYPVGKFARDLSGAETGPEWMWKLGYKRQFRELADVTALWHDEKWYLFPSVDMAWVSEDRGATWQHHPLNVRDLGYAPTVVKHKNKFLLMASESAVYTSDTPLGPYEELGMISLEREEGMPPFIDPMLFSDSDSRLYYYWGCSPTGGIWGIELDADDPTKVVGKASELIPFRPSDFPWEAVGAWNQNPAVGWMEGGWMLKRNGKYYLTYSAGGTENRTYAMGCYIADSPLGPFTAQKKNPILRSVEGLITGSAHGSIVAGPNDELWAFYSVKASVVHAFERRLGMDRAEIDTNGELVVLGATSLPQPLKTDDGQTQKLQWLPMNGELQTTGSTNAPNLEGRFAVDNEMSTWWQPATEDQTPILTSHFFAESRVNAIRIIWRDVGLDTSKGIIAGPIGYRVELETSKDQWTTILYSTSNQTDLLVDYRECQPQRGTKARLVITNWPEGITPAVTEFTVFGETVLNQK